ncbi:MAG TPA: asparagine synthase-related protein, partial [Longimicrobium sp.]|nr:asparagine synthase-related protein [Longimicrobium sp.]
SVVVGDPIARVAPEPAGTTRAHGRRMAVHRLLRKGPERQWQKHLDGHFAVLLVDHSDRTGFVLGDLASFIPLFQAADADGALVLGTHVDAVARAAGRTELDPVSAADLLVNLSSTYPHTLYRGVEQLPPAAARAFGPAGWSAEPHVYWRPRESERFRGIGEAADALRAAVAADVEAACADAEHVGLLLSGGEDSRAVLGAVPRRVRVTAFVYADWENREVRIARAVARAYGAELVFGARSPDHYMEGMETVASLVGSAQNFMDVHGWGMHERLGIRDLPLVLGGLSSDSFLKAEHAVAATDDPVTLAPASILRPELLEQVVERRTAFRRWLAELRPQSAGEWERLWPFSMRKHGANVHGNRRMFAAHEVFHSTGVLEVAAAVPVEWKRNRRLFHRAMRPFFARSWHVPHSRWRYPYFGAAANLPLAAGLRVTRLVRDALAGELRARQAPWPKWSRVTSSEPAMRAWRDRPPARTALAPVFVTDDDARIQESVRAEWHPLRQAMLLQLAFLAEKAR